jgi:hypothetical protein
MTVDFGTGPDRLKRWAAYILAAPDRFGADAGRIARAISTAVENVEHEAKRKKPAKEAALL